MSQIDPDAYASIVELLEQALSRFAAKPAFRCFGHTLTYADVDRLSLAFAAYLQHRLGVRKGDRVAVMLPNVPAFPVAMLGILRAGATQVNVNPLYTPRELEHQLNDAGVETLVICAESTPTLGDIVDRTAVKHAITVRAGDATPASLASPAVDAPAPGPSRAGIRSQDAHAGIGVPCAAAPARSEPVTNT
jgi:long-chain acyl-CoA synthetase